MVRTPFRFCPRCHAKNPYTDQHLVCNLCLSPDHQEDACEACKSFRSKKTLRDRRVRRTNRILTMCLPFGMVPTVEHCNTWGTVFAALYTTAHGTPALANLPEVLKQIQYEYGAAPALDLGMQLMGNFTTDSSIILSNLKGEAVALAVRMRLRDVPQQDQERELPKIIAETYSSIG
ncbi:hypothetical protein NDU88_005543 [Pleurodeles waltl]|uniref:Uncharacterized protein n=1 Tax=Pleurodeles waltl TaxID=8319 RepID=A0AAV7L134_PLEWA|nr:hypothetical protein NDU88_005543 [Pleurodeles waltl]